MGDAGRLLLFGAESGIGDAQNNGRPRLGNMPAYPLVFLYQAAIK